MIDPVEDDHIRSLFPFKVFVRGHNRDHDTIDEMIAASRWLQDNKGFGAMWIEDGTLFGDTARWTYRKGAFYCKSETDAVEFKLRFG